MNLRSFLDWLRSDRKAPEPATEDWREKRRENRVDLPAEHRLAVSATGLGSGQETLKGTLRNASVRGGRIVLDEPAGAARAAPGERFALVLRVDEADVPLSAQVVRVSESGIGVRFVAPFPKELERLERFLEPRCLGRSLREIDSRALQAEPDKILRWFQGVNETALFSWQAGNGRIIQQQLVFLDRVAEWSGLGGVRTGRVRSEAERAEPGWVRSEILDFDPDPDAGILDQARTVLESSAIDETIRTAFLEKLS